MSDDRQCKLLPIDNCIKYVKIINELSSRIVYEKTVNLILLHINEILGILLRL